MLCVHSVLALAVHRVTRELDPLLLQRRSGATLRALPGVTPKRKAHEVERDATNAPPLNRIKEEKGSEEKRREEKKRDKEGDKKSSEREHKRRKRDEGEAEIPAGEKKKKKKRAGKKHKRVARLASNPYLEIHCELPDKYLTERHSLQSWYRAIWIPTTWGLTW